MSDCIPYEKTKRFKSIFIDYINQHHKLIPFYKRFPKPENFSSQIKEKLSNYKTSHRKLLVSQLNAQYKDFEVSELTQKHINLLAENNTFTITTGHQLNLFTGPLYTFYKIISVIKSCKRLKESYPSFNFVPIFWLASEDHDFDEINHFHLHSETLSWQKQASGAVGELSTEGINKVLEEMKSVLPENNQSAYLLSLFEEAYCKHPDLSQASIFLYNYLFAEWGLVILEPNTSELKRTLKPYIKKDVFFNLTHKEVTKTSRSLLDLNYHEQVSPREINYFYKTKQLRQRLIFQNDKFYVNETDISFTKDELLEEIDHYPERFSPNALLRPLYQEVLLPNLSYVGGAGELAYWLQLKSTFEAFDVSFPMLQMRNSVLLYSQKTLGKLKTLNIKLEDLFQSEIKLKNQHVKAISEIKIDFTPQKNHLSEQFAALYELARKTDKSFMNAVAAQEKKQHNGLDKLEKRLLKAQRRKLSEDLERLVNLQHKLFPHNKLQERYVNFSDIYLTYGDTFIDFLMDRLEPFNYNFSLLELVTHPRSIPQKFTSDCI